MKVYINDILVRITDKKRTDKGLFDIVINDEDDIIQIGKLKGHVLIKNKSAIAIDNLLKIITTTKYKKIKSIEILVGNKLKAEEYLLSKFDVVEAAGGVVEKGDKILMILRNGLWDIPKGKMEKKEKKRQTAIREVEEETGVEVEIIDKIFSTWHTYIRNKKFVLKKTYWYRMKCLDDSNIKPQKAENIEKVVWMNRSEVDLALIHSFKTIKRLIKKYRKKVLEAT